MFPTMTCWKLTACKSTPGKTPRKELATTAPLLLLEQLSSFIITGLVLCHSIKLSTPSSLLNFWFPEFPFGIWWEKLLRISKQNWTLRPIWYIFGSYGRVCFLHHTCNNFAESHWVSMLLMYWMSQEFTTKGKVSLLYFFLGLLSVVLNVRYSPAPWGQKVHTCMICLVKNRRGKSAAVPFFSCL